MRKRKVIGLNLNEEELSKLEKLCTVYGSRPTEILRVLINAEYDKIEENPKIAEIMNKLQDLKKLLDTTTK